MLGLGLDSTIERVRYTFMEDANERVATQEKEAGRSKEGLLLWLTLQPEHHPLSWRKILCISFLCSKSKCRSHHISYPNPLLSFHHIMASNPQSAATSPAGPSRPVLNVPSGNTAISPEATSTEVEVPMTGKWSTDYWNAFKVSCEGSNEFVF